MIRLVRRRTPHRQQLVAHIVDQHAVAVDHEVGENVLNRIDPAEHVTRLESFADGRKLPQVAEQHGDLDFPAFEQAGFVEQLGRQLGYPTANVDLRRRQSAVMGIYAVRVQLQDDRVMDAVASVGTRPTFEDGNKPLLEVHIFDFDEDIYGEYIHVDFIARLRSEKKYESVHELVAQMHRDADNAKSILAA